MPITWQHYTFTQLDLKLLYAILRLRAEVFVVEQNCPYQDLDDKDQSALHLCGFDGEGRLAAYTRIFRKNVSYSDYASIGRVTTASFARGQGLGRPLMQESVRVLFEHYGEQDVKISAQAHLQKFYASVGYEPVGDIYDEDGIPHTAMIRSLAG